VIADSYPLLNVFWSMLVFFGFVIFIWLFIVVLIDVFRSQDMGGFAKALWVIFLIVLPVLGILVYLIARGGSMHERQVAQIRQQQDQFNDYVRETAGTTPADQLHKLADLRDQGVITEDEFQAQKAKILA
jgi:ABC-type multidrug transport system fused ATPase/permease subunit